MTTIWVLTHHLTNTVQPSPAPPTPIVYYCILDMDRRSDTRNVTGRLCRLHYHRPATQHPDTRLALDPWLTMMPMIHVRYWQQVRKDGTRIDCRKFIRRMKEELRNAVRDIIALIRKSHTNTNSPSHIQCTFIQETYSRPCCRVATAHTAEYAANIYI